jgi:hypothetical protein
MLDATASQAAGVAGRQLAIDFAAEWSVAVLLELRGWLAIQKAQGHSTMTFERFRHEARNQPDSHKAWGALPRLAQSQGLIRPHLRDDGSQVMRNAESLKTHGHPVRVWLIA